MIAAILLCASSNQDVAPRLRTLLPNGAVMFAEKMPAPAVSIHLFAANRSPDPRANHGWRHLLEHLMMLGRNSASPIDVRAEAAGMILLATTYRDAMSIEVKCKPNQVEQALGFISEVIRPLEIGSDEIKREIEVVRQEIGLDGDAANLSKLAWLAAYGDAGLDPIGTVESISKATVQQLDDLRAAQFAPSNLALSIVGPVDVDQTTRLGTSLLLAQRGGPSTAIPKPPPIGSARVDSEEVFGELRAVPVGSYRAKPTAAVYLAAIGLSLHIPDAVPAYMPAAEAGIVNLSRTSVNSGLGIAIDEIEEGDMPGLYALARMFAIGSSEEHQRSAATSSFLRGFLLSQNSDLKPDMFAENMRAVTYAEFAAAVGKFKKDECIIVVGARR